MVPLRGKGSESQDRLNLKEEIIMQINGNIYTNKHENVNCLFGKLEWRCDYRPTKNTNFGEVDVDEINSAWVTMIFEGLPCSKLMMVYLLIAKTNMPLRFAKDHNAIKIPGLRIRVNHDVTEEIFAKAMRQLFSLLLQNSAEK